MIDSAIDANVNNGDTLKTLFQSLLLITKIFQSINSQDLPEAVEDHMTEFMDIFQKYLKYQNPLLNDEVRFAIFLGNPLFPI